ncbi:glycosyltransferase [Halorhodospira halophila]|uniref:glycosyltransferase n=1 Tax=Halorhodospira TaxID=85108 RepID=UPI001EE94098|nr:glycosyltransferase [Halorhodospira halophila]MCG5544580.1 glycosyltransferase [Halorhodospira sp. 9628]
MRTLHTITGLGQGGAERQLASLVSVYPEESAIFSLKEPGVMAEEVRKAGVPIYTGGVGRSVSPAWMPKLRGAIRELRPDVVMGWMYHGNLAASLTRRLGHRGPIVWNVRHSVHDLGREKLSTRWVIRAGAWCARSPARIIYNSATAAEQHEGFGYPSDKRVVLPNGFDLERFKPDPDAREARRAALGVPADRFLLGVVGRAHPMKNHLGWLQALQMLVADGLPVHCVMAGTGVAEPEGPVATAVREAGLESAVTLLPPTDSPESLYPALDLLVMPSLWGEGFPNVVGEAMGCGVPALVTDVGDAASVVGETGFVAKSGDAEVLASRVRLALGHGREGLGRLGADAQERMLGCYGLESVAQRYRSLCSGLVGEWGLDE